MKISLRWRKVVSRKVAPNSSELDDCTIGDNPVGLEIGLPAGTSCRAAKDWNTDPVDTAGELSKRFS